MSTTRVPADIEGDLRGYPLPRLLYLLLKRAFLGRLDLRSGPEKKTSIYFRGGLPTFADSYIPELVLSQVLMERGLLDQEQLNKSLALLAQRKLLHGKILRTLGVIDEDQLVDALCLQLRRKLYRLFALPPETTFALYSGEHKYGRVDEAARVRADSLFVIYNGIRNSYSLARLQQELSKLGERKARLHPQFERIKKRFSFSDDEEPLLVLLEHDACSMRHLLSVSNLSPTHTHMLLYTLWVCEVLLPEGGASAVAEEESAVTTEAPAPRVPEPAVHVSAPTPAREPAPAGTQQILSLGRSKETVDGLPSVAHLAKSFSESQAMIDLPPPRETDAHVEAPTARTEAILLPPATGEQVVLTPPHVTGDYPAIELPPPMAPSAPPPAEGDAPVLVTPPPADDDAPMLVTPPPADDAPVLVTPPSQSSGEHAVIFAPPPVQEIGPTPKPPPAAPLPRTPVRKMSRSMEREGAADEHRALINETWDTIEGKSFFQLLGVERNATATEVKEAYFKRAKRFHPDRVAGLGLVDVAEKAAQIFQRLNEANMTLGDAKEREAYIRELETGVSTSDQEAEVRQALEAEFAFQKGMVFFRKKAYRDALEEFKAAYELNPDEGEHEAWLAWASFCNPNTDRKAELPRIREQLQHATRIAPKSANCHYFLGEVHLSAGDEGRALAAFKQALSVKSNHVESERQIRLINMRRDKADKGKTGLFGRFRKK